MLSPRHRDLTPVPPNVHSRRSLSTGDQIASASGGGRSGDQIDAVRGSNRRTVLPTLIRSPLRPVGDRRAIKSTIVAVASFGVEGLNEHGTFVVPTSSVRSTEKEDDVRPLPRSLLSIARRQHGLVTADDLALERYGGRARSAALEAGLLVPVHRGVYRIGSHEVTFDQRCRAALLAAPDAALAGRTAGRVWGLRKVWTDDVHVLARRAIKLEGVRPRRTDLLASSDVCERFGVRVLSPGRLLCDLAWDLDDDALESVFEQMLDRKLLTVRSARSAARRFVARGRPGSRRIVRLLDSRPEYLQPVDSDVEERLWRALADAGYLLDRQVVVPLGDEFDPHLDLGIRALRYGIEIDHVTWHGGRLDAQNDKRRDRALLRIGWTVSRVTDEDVRLRLVPTVQDLIAIIDRLGRDQRARSDKSI